MKIAIIGATGRVGGLVTAEAHSRGHEVVGIAPDPSRINGDVEKRSGDLRKPDTIIDAVRGSDVVVAAVADRTDPKRTLIPYAARTLLEVLPKAGVRRLLWCGGGGTLESKPGLRFIDEPGFPSEYRAEEQKALLAYQQTTQEAFREVSDALIGYQHNRRFLAQQQALTQTLADADRLARTQYQGGVTAYLNVLEQETQYFSAQLQLAQARLNELDSVVALYQALGGGWQP